MSTGPDNDDDENESEEIAFYRFVYISAVVIDVYLFFSIAIAAVLGIESLFSFQTASASAIQTFRTTASLIAAGVFVERYLRIE